jgi:hypothetical protein
MTDNRGAKYVREPVQAYLDQPDRDLLDDLVQATGLAKAELLRRGIRRLSAEILGARSPGWSLDHLVGSLDDEATPDLSTRHDDYLYGETGRGKSGPR